jgi:pyocin large subunit-like protein
MSRAREQAVSRLYTEKMRSVLVAVCLLLSALMLLAQGPGFRSRRQFDEHYAKHGSEFGHVTQQEYLRLAQHLRDTPAGGPILEADKPGGIVTKFDRRNGYFIAYNADRTIRTFFIPNDGERYFRRQAKRPD